MPTAPSFVTTEMRRVLLAEAEAVKRAASKVGSSAASAVALLVEARLVHVSGVGKSGHIAQKIAGTLSSTGTPAAFLHPTEALHGDLGRVQRGDVAIVISRSGACDETLALARELRRSVFGGQRLTFRVPVIALTGVLDSDLAATADVVLDCSVLFEACPHGLAPTSSTAVALAMGDALAAACMKVRGTSPADFKRTHPGGALGKVEVA